MVRPRFGIGLRADLALTRHARLGRLAEGLGFDVVSLFADLGYGSPFPPLTAIARVTERVRVGPACVNPYTMPPAEIAEHIAGLDDVSSGRAYLGLARGAWLEAAGVPQPRPLRALREAAEIVRKRRDVPLLIGAWGERTTELAGEIAGELKVGGSANPDLVPIVRTRLSRGAATAGRETDATAIVFGAVTVVDDDATAARERARAAVAMYFEVVAGLDPTLEVPGRLVQEVGDRLRAGDDRGAGALIPDRLLGRFAFAGTPEEVAAQARALFDAGAQRVEFGAPFGLGMDQGLRLLGERVLPDFR